MTRTITVRKLAGELQALSGNHWQKILQYHLSPVLSAKDPDGISG